MIDFTNRVVLVTGAAGGIGAATARTIAGCGGAVVVHDVREGGRLAELAGELGSTAIRWRRTWSMRPGASRCGSGPWRGAGASTC